jgi:hypothetical protein
MSYIIAPALGLTSIWMLGYHDPRPDILGKLISSVIFLLLCVGLIFFLNWRKKSSLQKKIKGAVLSRPKAVVSEEPPAV